MSDAKYSPKGPMTPLIRAFLRAHGLEQKYDQARAVQAWPDVVGPTAASHSIQVRADNGILFVKVDSPALKVELNAAHQEILAKLHTLTASKVIHTLAIL